jgi:hypothetical protein
MQDRPYPGAPAPITRELDRIQAGLSAGGATITGRSVSVPDEIACRRPAAPPGWQSSHRSTPPCGPSGRKMQPRRKMRRCQARHQHRPRDGGMQR